MQYKITATIDLEPMMTTTDSNAPRYNEHTIPAVYQDERGDWYAARHGMGDQHEVEGCEEEQEAQTLAVSWAAEALRTSSAQRPLRDRLDALASTNPELASELIGLLEQAEEVAIEQGNDDIDQAGIEADL